MNRSRAMLPRFSGEADVLAAKIVTVEDMNLDEFPGAKRLIFDDGSRANMHPTWVDKWNPQVGGYFVIFDKGDARYMEETKFKQKFKKEKHG